MQSEKSRTKDEDDNEKFANAATRLRTSSAECKLPIQPSIQLPASLPSQDSTTAVRNDARFLVESFDFPRPIAVIPAVEKQDVTTPDGGH
jgi:hypothetical protein